MARTRAVLCVGVFFLGVQLAAAAPQTGRGENPLGATGRIGVDPLPGRQIPVPAQVAPDLVTGPGHGRHGLVETPFGVEVENARQVQRRDRRRRGRDVGLLLLVSSEGGGEEEEERKHARARGHIRLLRREYARKS